MAKLLQEIREDVDFVKSHTLQPKWYKALKVFILAGFLVGYDFFFGWKKTILFLAIFLALSLFVHVLYRTKTGKWTHSWLDFQVTEESGRPKPTRIGIYYYFAILLNALISAAISQVIP